MSGWRCQDGDIKSVISGWSCQDSGIGMTAADAARVFTRFFRSPAVRDGSIPGAGLGLSITKAIVEGHGGSITCSTFPGRGSTFTVELPADGHPAAF